MIDREGRALSRPKIMGRHRGRPSPLVGGLVKLPLLKPLRDLSQQTRTAIDKSSVNLEECSAGLHFFSRRFSIENSTATDYGNGRTCRDAAHERSRFLTKRRATQAARLVAGRRNRRVIEGGVC